jgi:phenylacetate-CoA ligase
VLSDFQSMQSWSREELDAWRVEKLQALLRHAFETTPYWRDLAKELGAEPEDFKSSADLARLPTLSKDVIMAEQERLHAEDPGSGRVTEKSTGGSTGRNIWIKVDIGTHDRRRAAGMLTETWDDVHHGTRLATLWGSPLDAKPSLAARIYDNLANRVFYSVYGVTDETLDRYLDELARFKPEVISSYPSILSHLARRAGKERCRALGARVIYSSAEVLFDDTRAEIEELFGAPVRNRYATRELGIVASDCPEGAGMHLMDMRFFVETGEPAAPGEPAELIVTDLDNRAFPMIRYRIEDMGRLIEGACPCGRPFRRLASLDGRTMDVIQTPDGRMFGGTFFSLLFRPADRTVEQFQVVQESIDRLHIRIVPGPNYGPERRSIILGHIKEKMGEALKVQLDEVDQIEPLPSGKHRFVVSKVPKQKQA